MSISFKLQRRLTAMHYSRTFTLIIFLLIQASLLNAWSDEFVERANNGRRRLLAITNAVTSPSQADTNRPCLIHNWYTRQDAKADVIDIQNPQYLSQLNVLGGLGMGELFEVEAQYPRNNPTTHFDNLFDPDAGVIVFKDNEIASDANSRAPMSLADIVWEIYKAACIATSPAIDATKIQYLVHTEVQSDDADYVFNNIWDAASQAEQDSGKLTFTDIGADEIVAVLGLDNGAAVSGLLQYHNVEMGKKMMSSMTLAKELRGSRPARWHFWWQLKAANDGAFNDLRNKQCHSDVTNGMVNCFNGQPV